LRQQLSPLGPRKSHIKTKERQKEKLLKKGDLCFEMSKVV
jgi:hypothetical protein